MKKRGALQFLVIALMVSVLSHVGLCASTAAGEKEFTNSIGMKFVSIPAGEFMMGSREDAESVAKNPMYSDKPGNPKWYEAERPMRKVTITKPFFLQTTEVTVGQFRQFIAATGYRMDAEKEGGAWIYDRDANRWVKKEGVDWQNPGFPQGDNHPVTCVSWNDAQAFVVWLNNKEGMDTYRLPTESQWEYAARAGTETPFFWGVAPDVKYANFADASYAKVHTKDENVNRRMDDGYAFTAPVGSFQPNAWGLYDMSGNVWEWCSDWYGEFSGKAVVDPPGRLEGKMRVVRGGSWGSFAPLIRSSVRISAPPGDQAYNVGFRVAKTVNP